MLVAAGYRFHHFPDKADCCKCCAYASGSYLCGGPMSPRWVDNSTGNLVYLGVHDVKVILHYYIILGYII